MRIINITDQDRASLASLDQEFTSVSEMQPSEREFLTALIREKKPKKILEVGVAAGSSSVVLLNALHSLERESPAKLYSIDYSTQLYRDNSKKTGYIVDKYPHLHQNWQLFTGGLACDFMEEIGGDIDFCLLDTVHALPGEILDFLMVFPYLKDSATLVLHDTNLHTWKGHSQCMLNNLLISTISGTKLIPEYFENTSYVPTINEYFSTYFTNIAAVELKDQKDSLWDLFNLLTQHWVYMPDDHDIELLRETFQKHYDNYFVEMFGSIVEYQKMRFSDQPKANRISIWTCVKYKLLYKILFGASREKYKEKFQKSVKNINA